MPFEIQTEADLAGVEAKARSIQSSKRPAVLSVAELMALEVAPPSMLIEGVLPASGASLMFGAPKSNTTLFAVQTAIAVASGHALLDYDRVIKPGPALIVEQDDPAGAASLSDILRRSPVPVEGIPFYLAPRVPFTFGLELLEWLEAEIVQKALRLIVLDSYTALRGPRTAGVDIVKAEQNDLTMLDELAKRTGCAMEIVHHDSKGSAGLEWSSKAAGTFAMSAATGAQIHISRFPELDSNASERLVRIRGRHLEGTEMVLRFRKDTLDHEHVLEGGVAPFYPILLQLQTAFGGDHHRQRALLPRTGYVALAGSTMVGYIAGHLTTRHDCAGEVLVAPEFRRRGIASTLLRCLADWFLEKGASRVCVCVDANSPAAQPFYQNLGASPLSPSKKYWYIWQNITVLLNRDRS